MHQSVNTLGGQLVSVSMPDPIEVRLAARHKLLVVQFGGDYREAYQNMSGGQPECYANQDYSVQYVRDMTQHFDEVATLCCLSAGAYSDALEPGVRAIGVGMKRSDPYALILKKTIEAIRNYRPSYVILRTPAIEILRWLRSEAIPASLMLADSFNGHSPADKLRYFRLARECNHPNVRWIGNHGIGSCLSLRGIGVSAAKIVPWDWPDRMDPSSRPAKFLVPADARNLLYVGAISTGKGVMDCVEALTGLRKSGMNVHLHICGQGEVDVCRNIASASGVQDYVHFCGLLPNSQVVEKMAEADVVLVPSRRSYPEGFPKTIKEALCSRTPLVVSDHPIFARFLKNRSNAMVFESGSSESLAERVKELLIDGELYRSLSQRADTTWRHLQVPVKWGDLLEKIALDSPESHAWLAMNRLNSGQYNLSR